jgi:hypothetical protein
MAADLGGTCSSFSVQDISVCKSAQTTLQQKTLQQDWCQALVKALAHIDSSQAESSHKYTASAVACHEFSIRGCGARSVESTESSARAQLYSCWDVKESKNIPLSVVMDVLGGRALLRADRIMNIDSRNWERLIEEGCETNPGDYRSTMAPFAVGLAWPGAKTGPDGHYMALQLWKVEVPSEGPREDASEQPPYLYQWRYIDWLPDTGGAKSGTGGKWIDLSERSSEELLDRTVRVVAVYFLAVDMLHELSIPTTVGALNNNCMGNWTDNSCHTDFAISILYNIDWRQPLLGSGNLLLYPAPRHRDDSSLEDQDFNGLLGGADSHMIVCQNALLQINAHCRGDRDAQTPEAVRDAVMSAMESAFLIYSASGEKTESKLYEKGDYVNAQEVVTWILKTALGTSQQFDEDSHKVRKLEDN